MAFERKKVGEDWTDSDKNLKTTGTLESGDQTVTGAIDASGEITGASIVQGSETVLDESDLVAGGGAIIGESNIVNTGPSAPTSTFAGKFWFDTANNLLKIRNEADNAWLDIWDTANDKPIITNLTDEILGTMLADAIAGAGIIKDGSENLALSPDDATIELSGDTLRVKNAGITVGKLATGNAQVSVSSNDSTPGRLNGKLIAGDNVTLTENDDGSDETLTIDSKFRGAQVSRVTSNFTITEVASPADIEWNFSDYDTDTFSDIVAVGPNPERLTIPANVDLVRISVQIVFDVAIGTADSSLIVSLRKNGSLVNYSGNFHVSLMDDPAFITAGIERHVNASSGIIEVSEGDYFTCEVTWVDNSGTSDIDVVKNTYKSWMCIEVLG